LTEWIESVSEKYTLRNAYQWMAMGTMAMDHVGYLYDISCFRYFGRMAMPLYAILFVMTVRSGHLNLPRLFWLAAASQLPAMYVVDIDKMNIIFGFWIFGWTVLAFEKRNWFDFAAGLLMMLLPVSYDWYLYATMFILYCLRNTYAQGAAFALVTAAYTFLFTMHPRQLLAVAVPFIQGIKAPRPDTYLYRYFYPGHLIILAALKYLQMDRMV